MMSRDNHHIAIYRERLHLEDATFTQIEHEDALAAIVYKVTVQGKAPYILKICLLAHHYARELYFLSYFAGKLPVPKLIDHVPPDHLVSGAILMECLRGTVLKRENITPALAFHMGTLLAKIHLNRAPGFGDLIKPDSLSNQPHKSFITKFQKSLAECSSHLSQNRLTLCEKYMQDHLALLDSVDGPCIVHGDYRPGNIMVFNSAIQGIIDWSASRADFAEEDFCSLEYHDWAKAPAIKASFLDGYASIRPVPEYTEIIPLLKLSKALASMGWTIRTNTWDNKGASFYQMNRKLVEGLER